VLSLTRGRVCHLQLQLAFASRVIFGSESHGTHDHILLSQIQDFLFRRLLQLAGLQWRYYTPPPHRVTGHVIGLIIYEVWIDNWIYGTLQIITTSNYSAITNSHTLCNSLQCTLSLLNLLYLHQLSSRNSFQCRSILSFSIHAHTGQRLSHN
jgi:hypothetical protein